MSKDHPKLFISYSWSSPEHMQRVYNLATDLIDNGIDVHFDKWGLKEGYDIHVFMEKMVTDSDKVIIVCDQKYAEKANERSGGVGTETQIISPEIYGKADQSKFVAVVTEVNENGKPYLPIYYGSRMYIDLSNDDLHAINFEQLVRWIYDKPSFPKPDIGKKPSYLSEMDPIHLGTVARYKRAFDAIKESRNYAKGSIDDYFQTFAENLEKFRISTSHLEFDNEVIENIDKFLPYRDEATSIFLAIAQYRNTRETWQQLHRFFEKLILYTDAKDGISDYMEQDFDNFKFIIYELFLYAVSSFLRYECFDAVTYLINHPYYVEKNATFGRDVMVPYTALSSYIKSFENRNKRLNLRRLSLMADLLEKRSKTSGFTFKQIMQSDFILFIRGCFDKMNNNKYYGWQPETLAHIGFHDYTFELFSRSQSKEYFDRFKCIFDIGEKEDLIKLLDAFKEKKLNIPCWDHFTSFKPDKLIGFDNISTRP